MTRHMAERLAELGPVLLGAVTIVFVLVHLSGDPAALMLPPNAPPEEIVRFRHAYGFDEPLFVQYIQFLGQVLHGQLGESFTFRQPAVRIVLERLPATAELALASVLVSIAAGIPLGVSAAVRRGSILERFARIIVALGQGTPPFWLGLMLIVLLSVRLHLVPSAGRGGLSHLVLPTLTLSAFFTAALARLTRAGMIEVLDSPYVRTARAKGLYPRRVLYRHALRNTFLPVVTMIGLQTGTLLGGAVITETIFAWPGVGRLVVESIFRRDYPVVQAAMLVIVTGFVLVNLAVDLSYSVLDPRVRYD